MNQTIDAIYENGVLRPLQKIDIPEHQRVSIIIDTSKKYTPEEILHLAEKVYSGFSEEEIVEIEKIVLDRSHFFREN